LIDYDPTPGLQGTIPEPLLQFYVAIIRLDRCAALTFKKGVDLYTDDEGGKEFRFPWKRRPKSFLSLPRMLADWQVPLEGSDLHEQLTENLKTAIIAAENLLKAKEKEQWRKQGLGADGIVENLRAFQSSIMDGNKVRRGAALNLMDLIWIGNLFWHSLRFDLSYYPTTAELAFQISLYKVPVEIRARTTPPLLAQAAQAMTDRLRRLTEWFSRYGEGRRPSPFYAALAEWLSYTYLRYSELKQTGSPRVPVPLVFTTNYDREIEEALKALQCDHHLVLPVQFVSHKVGQPYEPLASDVPLWLMKSVHYEDGAATHSWHYAGTVTEEVARSNEDQSDRYQPTRDHIGPIIVKLHGSPLEGLPTARVTVDDLPHEQKSRLESKKFNVEYRHRIIVSESDYLADLRRDLPLWLRKRLQAKERALFFLGQSIADWNIRLRLADHASWSDNHEHSGEVPARDGAPALPNRFAVNRSLGAFDVAFMGPLGIAYIQAELRQVRNVLENAVLDNRAAKTAR
jgi:hypothetical protein